MLQEAMKAFANFIFRLAEVKTAVTVFPFSRERSCNKLAPLCAGRTPEPSIVTSTYSKEQMKLKCSFWY